MGHRDRRSTLVHEAFRVIAEHGLEGLRLRAVAAGAGIDHSTLHHHFATKQDLIVAVVGLATEPLRATIAEDGTPRERLDGHLATLASMLQSRPDLFVVLAEIDLRARRDPEVAVAVNEVEAGWRLALTALFRDSRISADPEDLTELTIAAVKGVRLDPVNGPAVLATLRALLSRAPHDSSAVGVR